MSVRRLLHERRVACQGFVRDDGNFEIEACLQDTSGQDTSLLFKDIAAGESIHEMVITMVLDPDLVIRELRAVSAVTPGPECPQAARAYESLQGLRVGPGFARAVKERVQAHIGCTHLTELIGPMATVALQTFNAQLRAQGIGRREALAVAGSCYAFREGGLALRKLKREA